jgi:hypothetical protein
MDVADTEVKRGCCSILTLGNYDSGFREQEVVHLCWPDLNLTLNMIRGHVETGSRVWPKRWEEREVPVPKPLTPIASEARQ